MLTSLDEQRLMFEWDAKDKPRARTSGCEEIHSSSFDFVSRYRLVAQKNELYIEFFCPPSNLFHALSIQFSLVR